MKNKFFLLAITFCLPIHSQGVSKSFILLCYSMGLYFKGYYSNINLL